MLAGAHIDCLVTLGAGSLTDAVKLVRLALANSANTEEDINILWDMTGSNLALREAIVKLSILSHPYPNLVVRGRVPGHSRRNRIPRPH